MSGTRRFGRFADAALEPVAGSAGRRPELAVSDSEASSLPRAVAMRSLRSTEVPIPEGTESERTKIGTMERATSTPWAECAVSTPAKRLARPPAFAQSLGGTERLVLWYWYDRSAMGWSGQRETNGGNGEFEGVCRFPAPSGEFGGSSGNKLGRARSQAFRKAAGRCGFGHPSQA